MLELKDLLRTLQSSPLGAKLQLVSGRRPRMVHGQDVRSLGEEILSDEQVLEVCRRAGGQGRADDLSERPSRWTHAAAGALFEITAMWRGREVIATLVLRDPKDESAEEGPARDTHTKRALKAVRKNSRETEAARSKRPPGPSTRHSQPAQRRVTPRERAPVLDPRRDSFTAIPNERLKREPPPAPAEARPEPDEPRPEPRPRPADPAPEPRRAQPPPAKPAPPAADSPPAPKPAPAAQPEPKQAAPIARGGADSLHEVVKRAVAAGASDVHLAVEQEPHMRVDDQLLPMPGFGPSPRALVQRWISEIVPQRAMSELVNQGGISFAADVGKAGRVRVNASTTLAGPKLALRLLPGAPPTVESLGLPAAIEEATRHHQGLVVITGSSGQGKTCTLAALVSHINEQRAAHVIMVEDPTEILIPSQRSIVSQREVGSHATSYERALKGALRQDPDVIVVGELRDVSTVRMALSASETGHLVLGTMNTPNAKSAIDRLIDLFPPADQPQVRSTLAGGLRLVTSQRLVPKKDGGRAVACEILPGSVALWSLIRDEKTFQIGSLMQRGRGAGITRLSDSLADLVRAGTISKEAALLACEDESELMDLLEPRRPALLDEPRTGAADSPADKLGALWDRAGAIFGRKGPGGGGGS